MRGMILALLWIVGGGGEGEEHAFSLLKEGKYAEAAAALRKVVQEHGANPRRCYNLALALWRAGRLEEAQTEAERAATLSNGELSALRDGILGNVQLQRARAEKDLRKALALAERARDLFLAGATRSGATDALRRNYERALRLVDELRRKLQEQRKRQQQQQQRQRQQQQQPEQQPKQQRPQQQQEPRDQHPRRQPAQSQKPKDGRDRNRPQEGKDAQEKARNEPRPRPEVEPKTSDQERNAPPERERAPAPGEERRPEAEFTPEEKQRLLRMLERLQEEKRRFRAMQRLRRRRVEKDW